MRYIFAFAIGLMIFNLTLILTLEILMVQSSIAYAISFCVAIFFGLLIAVPYPAQQTRVPPEQRYPRIEQVEVPSVPEGPQQPSLKLIIRGGNNDTRLGAHVKPDDLGIRPLAEFTVHAGDAVIGKQATMLFFIASPRRRTRYDWQQEVPFTFKAGHNKVWPQKGEFLIAGQNRPKGIWTIEVKLHGGDNSVFPWSETTFLLQEEQESPSINLGSDASLSKTERRSIAQSQPSQSVEDLLDGL